MKNQISFIHLADLHIGMKVVRFEKQVFERIREARYQALENALLAAIERRVDFAIIAGDIFDDNTVDGIDAVRVYDMLKGKAFPVYILPGNHDPLQFGSVWKRAPWDNLEGTSIRLLSERKPIEACENVLLYPCPVTQKLSVADPTDWIGTLESDPGVVRIGVAHGTVMDREILPHDDHPIDPECAEKRGLDYLALGHWHGQKLFSNSAGITRMAYPGTHEQMGFGKEAKYVTGWEAYTSQPGRDDFLSSEAGKALLVRIDRKERVPAIEAVETGQLSWIHETIEVHDDEHFSSIFSGIATRKDTDRKLLHLKLKGVLSAEQMVRIDAFKSMLGRYLFCELDIEDLILRPEDEALEKAMGAGLLRDVLRTLMDRRGAETDGRRKMVLEKAMINLYRLAREVER